MFKSGFSFHLSYRLIVRALVGIALMLAAGYLIISYIWQLQEDTQKLISENAESMRNAHELRLALYRVRAASLTYVFDRSDEQLLNLEVQQKAFLSLLEKTTPTAVTPTETQLVGQIAALFSNYQQTLKNALEMNRQGKLSQPGAVIVLASQDLINTIETKTNELVSLKQSRQTELEQSIKTNDNIIGVAIYSLGISGIVLGLILGWMIARIILNPIYKMVLKVRDAAGSEVVEHIRINPGKELEELDIHINRLIGRINKANEDLQINRELLERNAKSAAIGKIAPALAHEIRNPLTSVKLLIHSVLQDLGEDAPQKTDLEIMLDEISRMESFLQDFLKYARPAKPQMHSTNIIEQIQQTVQLMQAGLKQANIRIEENYHAQTCHILADANMLRQIFINLMMNAKNEMNTGGILRISTLEMKGDAHEIQIMIEDTGPGIPAEIMDSLFDPFVKGAVQGLGLGLSISQRIADLHHGHISAHNKSDSGAVFILHLPLAKNL